MLLTDTHSHIYCEEFRDDIDEVIQRAVDAGVGNIFLPVTEYASISPMLHLYNKNKDLFFPMVGLYPESVKEDYKEELSMIEPYLEKEYIVGIGEIGLDFYWDRNFEKERMDAFMIQMQWSKNHNDMMTSIHCRKAFSEIYSCFKTLNFAHYNGAFHCFSGDINDAHKVIELGFMLGIGGVVTFKNSHLAKIIKEIPLRHLVLETDSPYLTPVPHRGERNESSYIIFVAQKIAEIKEISLQQVMEETTNNAQQLIHTRKKLNF